jgi:hypothetical protein
VTSEPMPSDKRKCEWCAESISQQALRCPRCQKWRKDIDAERVKCWTWSLLGFLPALLLFVGLRNNWWAPPLPPGRFWLTMKFSFAEFLTSPSGWLVLGGLILTEGLCLRYYIRVSKKVGSWWWF